MTDNPWGAEIVDLHRFFEGWFRGERDDLERLEAALAPEFVLVGPDGATRTRGQVVAGVTEGRDSSPRIRIEIEDVALVAQRRDVAVVAYTEVQHRDGGTTRRRSTAVLQGPPLRWLAVHETWIGDQRP